MQRCDKQSPAATRNRNPPVLFPSFINDSLKFENTLQCHWRHDFLIISVGGSGPTDGQQRTIASHNNQHKVQLSTAAVPPEGADYEEHLHPKWFTIFLSFTFTRRATVLPTRWPRDRTNNPVISEWPTLPAGLWVGWWGRANNKARANQIPKGVSELSSCSVTENTPFSMDMIFEYSSCSFAPTEPDETNSQQTVADASGRPSWSASITCFSSVKTQRRAQQQHCKSSISLAFIDFVCCS